MALPARMCCRRTRECLWALFSRGQLARMLYTSLGMSTFMGQAFTQRVHMVQTQAHGVLAISSSRPRTSMRTSLRGSISKSSEAGQPAVQVPQVRHKSKLAAGTSLPAF
jgi:hypothetical protein